MTRYLVCMLNEIQIEQLQEWITDTYGTPEELVKQLDELIYMLHYIEEEVFTKRERQDAVEILRGIKRALGSENTSTIFQFLVVLLLSFP